MLTEAASRKARLIEAAGRFTLMVERVMPTVRYVSVEGPVTRTVPGTDELLREIAARYPPPDKVPAYIDFAEYYSRGFSFCDRAAARRGVVFVG